MSIQHGPHYRIASAALADWLQQQGLDRWWNVDGDPILAGRLSFPCPVDELAAELRRLNRMLIVQGRPEDAAGRGQEITASDLDQLVTRLGDNAQITGAPPPWTNDRLFFLCWIGQEDEWLLVEDQETTERSREDAMVAEGARK